VLRKTIVIKNTLGIHARPAASFVKTAQKFKSSVKVVKDGIEANGKSILDLLVLAAERGSTVELVVDGEDEEQAMATLSKLLEGRA